MREWARWSCLVILAAGSACSSGGSGEPWVVSDEDAGTDGGSDDRETAGQDDRLVVNLDTSEHLALCIRVDELFFDQYTSVDAAKHDECLTIALSAAYQLPSDEAAALSAACQDRYDSCMNAPYGSIESRCGAGPECSSTVAEVEACMAVAAPLAVQRMARAPTCETVDRVSLDEYQSSSNAPECVHDVLPCLTGG